MGYSNRKQAVSPLVKNYLDEIAKELSGYVFDLCTQGLACNFPDPFIVISLFNLIAAGIEACEPVRRNKILGTCNSYNLRRDPR